MDRRGASAAAFAAIVGALVLGAAPSAARAFCGFYVSGGGEELYNNATMVVMMREGTRTVLSMQNNYEGPPENFAMVVPVPVVLQEENVKTLSDEVFDRVDRLAAPRLVEYWEQDPCGFEEEVEAEEAVRAPSRRRRKSSRQSAGSLGVTIEAEFEVGEYEIVILSAEDSAGLDTWLRQEEYEIPEGAEPLLRPYVEEGSKFFVAKVNVDKVRFEDNQAILSPLRFHYDTDEFRLPVRLGLMNAKGKQDLLVHILAKGQRYEVANYDNVTIPTNIDVAEDARDRFGAFYVALFDRTLERNPNAVVTEYAWDASSCDPCPTPALRPNELMTLGADVLPSTEKAAEGSDDVTDVTDPLAGLEGLAKRQPRRRPRRGRRRPRPRASLGGFVLTRLHARYDAEQLGEDLVFKQAPPIEGGRERWRDGGLERGASRGRVNNFQARYAIRHRWKGPIECDNPRRGVWGGPPSGGGPREPKAARDLAFEPRGEVQLASMVRSAVPAVGIDEAPEPEPAEPKSTDEEPSEQPPQGGASGGTAAGTKAEEDDDGCGSCALSPARGASSAALFGLVAAVLLRRRRR